MSAPKYHSQRSTTPCLQTLTNGINAVAILLAEAATRNHADKGTVADACYLIADLAGLIQEIAEGESA